MNGPLVLAWCDDLFLLGHQLARWIVDYVDLEESLAMGTVSQDLLAHAGALLGICGFDAERRDRHVYQRPAEQWFPSGASFLPAADWPATVARGFLVNQGVIVLRHELRLPDRPSTQKLAVVIAGEQDLHMRHWQRWVAILGTHPTLGPGFLAALQEAADDAADLFSLPEGASGDELIVADPADLYHRWVDQTGSLLRQMGVPPPLLPPEPRPGRRPAAGREAMHRIIADLRHTRGAAGAREYEVYR